MLDNSEQIPASKYSLQLHFRMLSAHLRVNRLKLMIKLELLLMVCVPNGGGGGGGVSTALFLKYYF